MSCLIDLLTCIKDVDLERYERMENIPFIPHTQHLESEPIVGEGMDLTLETQSEIVIFNLSSVSRSSLYI